MVLGGIVRGAAGPTGDDVVSTGHGESSDLAENLINMRKKRRTRKTEQQKKKTPGMDSS